METRSLEKSIDSRLLLAPAVFWRYPQTSDPHLGSEPIVELFRTLASRISIGKTDQLAPDISLPLASSDQSTPQNSFATISFIRVSLPGLSHFRSSHFVLLLHAIGAPHNTATDDRSKAEKSGATARKKDECNTFQKALAV
jgi:hypothetical protein